MRWLILSLLVIPVTIAGPYQTYYSVDYRDRISFPHIYPGQTITTEQLFLADTLRPGTSTVRWTSEGSYSINLDRVHLMRGGYTLIIKSKKGPQIKQLPFETTKIYLEPNYFKISYEKETHSIRLAKYAD